MRLSRLLNHLFGCTPITRGSQFQLHSVYYNAIFFFARVCIFHKDSDKYFPWDFDLKDTGKQEAGMIYFPLKTSF